MLLKTARRGRNAGRQFWSCSGYASKTCDGTLDAGGPTQAAPASATRDVSSVDALSQPRIVVAQPLHAGADTVYLDLLAVPADSLESTADTHSPRKPIVGAQWRMSYARPEPRPLDTRAVRALSVADKIVCKGRITLLPEELESLLDREPSEPNAPPQRAWVPALDSPEELAFWTDVLPACLGAEFAVWCTPQVEVSTLTGGADYSGTEQRVDFLIAHPALERPLVIEVDGEQHAARREHDATRDRHLGATGYAVIRVPAAEVRAGGGSSLDPLRNELTRLEPPSAFGLTLRSPIRRAGQIQAALLQAMHVGLVDPCRFSVSTDLVDVGELTPDEFAAVVADLSDLLVRLGRMYGAPTLGSDIVTTAQGSGELQLSFHGLPSSGETISIEDAYLPFALKWPTRPVTPSRPVEFDRDDIRYFLRRVFRKQELRDGQYDIVSRALEAKDTVALLPTGAGKSIAFQLAGMLLPGRTIVIAPIISLIRDQVYNLRTYGIDRALGITSDLSGRDERDLAYELLQHGEAFFYYIAPERFQMSEFREKLRGMTAAFPVNLVVVDEAHCVSEWGHDFRTAYLRIGQTSRECSSTAGWVPALIALTGTASRAVLRDLQRELQIMDFDAIVTPSSFDREELQYAVLQERSEHKQFVLESYLRNALPSEFGLPPEAFFRRDGGRTYCGLIFCPNVNGKYGVVEVAGLLSGAGIDAAYYAGTRPKGFWGSDDDWKAYKRDTERRFKRDDVPVLVATNAFGMGVDKPNIRFTVHYGIPASIEAFYQEAGRAGRDGQKAVCAAIVSDDRVERNRQLLAPATPISEVARFVEDTPYEQNDDVTRTLFFHVQAFKGVETEIAVVTEVHNQLRPTGQRASRTIPFGVDAKLTEKALHRLVVVGVVADYTVDYSGRTFSVLLADSTRRSVVDRYVSYVAAYQRGRAEQERRKADVLPDEWDAFVVGVVEQYVQFVYDVIERGQRRAIAEMLAACQAGSGEDLRRRILDYLEQAEFSEAVESILSDERAGLGILADVLAEIVSPNDAARLRGPVARSLETYPDHPGLLLLRAATEALARDGDDQTIRENFEAFLVNARDAYGRSDVQIGEATGAVLKVIARRNSGAAALVEHVFLTHTRERGALRSLVAESGIAAAQVAPWVLLDEVSSGIDGHSA